MATIDTEAAPVHSAMLHVDALLALASDRPGFEWQNYAGAPEAYRSDKRQAERDGRDARTLIAALRSAVAMGCIGAERFQDAGRIEWIRDAGAPLGVTYCTGQYYPTEFRAGVCRYASGLLWDYYREFCGADTVEKIQRQAEIRLGRSIARRWFR